MPRGAAPSDQDAVSEEDAVIDGEPKKNLAIGPLKVIMKVFFAARFARPDLIRACTHLALFVTKWDRRCDQKLHRMMCYIHSTLEWRMIGWSGDELEDIQPHLFADADFAGCAVSSRSTTGSFLCIRGPSTFFPIAMQSKRQGCVSHSTPEAEIVAADFALRMMGLPALDLCQAVFPERPALFFHEDNQAMIAVCRSGRNPTMRHLHRTHRVSVDWLHEVFSRGDVVLVYESSDRQCADIFTKAFTNPEKWVHVCELVGIMGPSRLAQIDLHGKAPHG